MRIGYARVSTEEQNLALQHDALDRAGCNRIFGDEGLSAVDLKRPSFQAALLTLEPGDTLVVWRFDRAFRSSIHAIEVLDELRSRGIEFQSITEQIDTGTPYGRFHYQMIAGLAELERNVISLRTKEGMAAAKRQGKKFGRPRKLSALQIADARVRSRYGGQSLAKIAKSFGVSPSTVGRALRADA